MRMAAPACLVILATAVCLHAGVIRGVVVENFTSKPLARAEVILQPIGGTPGGGATHRADAHGGFVFDSLAEGQYLVKASRYGFMPAEYGQKRWNSAGTPVALEGDGSLFLNIRLLRYSAISGTVVDENEEGLSGHEVVAYRNSKPPEVMAHATADERGVYRLHGLTPGIYVVRTIGDQSNEGSYLPTFAKETDQFDQARTIELFPDQEAGDLDVRPLPGPLNSLSVSVGGVPPNADVAITLVCQLWRRTVKATSHHFASLAPGEYEVFAQAPSAPAPGEGITGGYQRISIGRDSRNPGVTVLLRPGSAVSVTGGPARDWGRMRIRRADLAGTGPSSPLPIVNGVATIPAGRWEIMLEPPSGYYVARFSPPMMPAAASFGRPDGWEEVMSPGNGGRFTLSGGPSAIRGTVKNSDEPVAGAPVYLEAYDPHSEKRQAELRVAISGRRGQYRFDNLAPGRYRILSTFEYLSPDVETMAAAGAQLLTVDARNEMARDLDLYVIR